MSYTDQKMSGGKIGALVIVALLHIALGYAFITGLAYQYVKKASEKLNTFDVQEPPPPPPDVPPPPPPPDQKFTPPPVVAPPPIVQTVTQAPPVYTTPVIAPPAPVVPPAPPAPPAPPVINQQAAAKGDPHGWFSDADYPDAARRANAEGRVTIRVTIGTDGRVAGCNVTSGSGNADLDATTCRIATRRGRYSAAKDSSGNAVQGASSFSIRWQLPKE